MSEPDAERQPLLAGVDLTKVNWPESPVPAALRAELFDRTSALVRSRARTRRLRMAGGWLAAYAAGLATAGLALSYGSRDAAPKAIAQPAGENAAQPTAEDHAQPTAQGAVAQINQAQITHQEDTTSDESADEATLPPEELRRRVGFSPRSEQIRLLRLAGDRYLYGAADVEAALDCYRQVLELTPAERRGVVEADDSWLLAELRSSEAMPAN